jgi:CBS-domain-containing membrane protein
LAIGAMNVIGGHVICTVIGLAALHWPVVSGALILVLIGWLYNNAVRKSPYPHYW